MDWLAIELSKIIHRRFDLPLPMFPLLPRQLEDRKANASDNGNCLNDGTDGLRPLVETGPEFHAAHTIYLFRGLSGALARCSSRSRSVTAARPGINSCPTCGAGSAPERSPKPAGPRRPFT